MTDNKCIVCGKDKISKNPKVLYCSSECKTIDCTRICPVCNEKFVVNKRSKKQEFCSKACATKLRNLNKLAGKKPIRIPKHKVNCNYCDKEFEVTNLVFERQKKFFCCKDHYIKYIQKDVEKRYCINCNTELIFKAKNKTITFCKPECKTEYYKKTRWINCTCANCGISFKKMKCSDKGQKKHFCTSKCYTDYRNQGVSRLERNNNTYQTFRSVLDATKEIKEWKRNVLNKYDNKCAMCDSNIQLHVHHIISAKTIIDDAIGKDYTDESVEKMKNNDLYTNINNGIVLCNKHHAMCHNISHLK